MAPRLLSASSASPSAPPRSRLPFEPFAAFVFVSACRLDARTTTQTPNAFL